MVGDQHRADHAQFDCAYMTATYLEQVQYSADEIKYEALFAAKPAMMPVANADRPGSI